MVNLSALHTVAFVSKETSKALICVRGYVDPRGILQPESIIQ